MSRYQAVRVLFYDTDDPEWLETTLARSIEGTMKVPKGSITELARYPVTAHPPFTRCDCGAPLDDVGRCELEKGYNLHHPDADNRYDPAYDD